MYDFEQSAGNKRVLNIIAATSETKRSPLTYCKRRNSPCNKNTINNVYLVKIYNHKTARHYSSFTKK